MQTRRISRAMLSVLRRTYRASMLGCIPEHHRRISPEARRLRPLHRQLPERRTEPRLIQRRDVRRQRHRVLPGNELTRRKRRSVDERLRELHIPRTHALGNVSVSPLCNRACDGPANAERCQSLTRAMRGDAAATGWSLSQPSTWHAGEGGTRRRGRSAGDRSRATAAGDRVLRPVGSRAPAAPQGRPARVAHLPRRDAHRRRHQPGVGDRSAPRAPPRAPPVSRTPAHGAPRRRAPPRPWARHPPHAPPPPPRLAMGTRSPTPRDHAGTCGVRFRPTGAHDGSSRVSPPTWTAVLAALTPWPGEHADGLHVVEQLQSHEQPEQWRRRPMGSVARRVVAAAATAVPLAASPRCLDIPAPVEIATPRPT